MPAPKKKGLDYFPHSVDLTEDPKLVKPRMKHGHLAVFIYMCLLEMIYKDEGYYLDYSDPDIVIWQIMSKCQGGKYTIKQDTIEDVIEDLVACELFSGDLQPEIITSKRIQETYYKATVERKMVDIDESIWLLSIDEMRELSAKHCYYLKMLNRSINQENRPNNEDNQPINPQSTGQDSTGQDSTTTAKNSTPAGCTGGGYSSSLELMEDIKAQPLSEYEMKRIVDMVDTYGEQWTLDALKVMGDNGKVKISYAEGILRNWKTNGRDSKKKGNSRSLSDRIMTNDTNYNDIYKTWGLDCGKKDEN